MKSFLLWLCVAIWFLHLVLGIGAGYAALRLWYFRRHPLMGKVGLYIHGFILEVITASTLLFLGRGVQLTWRFAGVWFIGTLLADVVRVPLIVYLIRGPREVPTPSPANSGDLPPSFWLDSVRQIVREEIEQRDVMRDPNNDYQWRKVAQKMSSKQDRPTQPSQPTQPTRPAQPSSPAPTPAPVPQPTPQDDDNPGDPGSPGKRP